MGLQRYGLVLAVILIVALGIVVVPVSADNPPDSGNALLMAENITLLDQHGYTFTELNNVSHGYSGPVLKVINSTASGETLYTIPASKYMTAGPGGLAITADGFAPSGQAIFTEPVQPEDPPGFSIPVPAPPESTLSRNTPDFSPLSGVIDSISPGDSLQNAIDSAADGDTISLDPGIYYQHGIVISKNLTIRANASAGGSRDNTIIDAEQLDGIFSLTGANTLALDNLTLRNATDPDSGGAVSAPSGGNLVISSTAFSNCSAAYSGGAIRSYYGAVNITSSFFSNCSTTHSSGGAIYTYRSTVEITTSSFFNCSSAYSGGAIYTRSGTFSAASTTFINCTALYMGGAIYTETSTTDVKFSTFRNCSTTHSGGAIYSDYDTINISSSTFTNCSAEFEGGAIRFGYGTVNVSSATFSFCSAWEGGAISTYTSTVDITSTTISDCSATYYGGAVYANYGIINVASSTISNCSAGYWGGAFYDGAGTLNIVYTTISDCSATDSGGAIFYFGDTLSISFSTFEHCTAGSMGGAIYSGFSTANVTSSSFSRCSANTGGAIFVSDGTVNVTSSGFSDCSASLGGAIFFYFATAVINSSTFSDCTAQNGGAINCNTAGILGVSSSTFSNCRANYGGAVITFGTATIGNNSVFTGCSAIGGGAVHNSGTAVIIASSTISDCSADYMGGAVSTTGGNVIISVTEFTNCTAIVYGGGIYNNGGTLNISASSFSGCLATGHSPSPGNGGAIFNSRGTITIADFSTFTECSAVYGGTIYNSGTLVTDGSSAFTNCSAYYGSVVMNTGSTTINSSTITLNRAIDGSAIYNAHTAAIHFSRFYQNTATSGNPVRVVISGVPVDATNNWWGSNRNPSNLIAGLVTTNPWLVLRATAYPDSIHTSMFSDISARLTLNSEGEDTSGGGIYLPDNISTTFAVVSGTGSVLPLAAGTMNGTVSTRFSPAGVADQVNISTRVDDQTVFVTLRVAEGGFGFTPYYTESGDDSMPAVIPSPVTGTLNGSLMTVTVNIGGNSGAGKATVTGTKLSDLVVTGTVQSGQGTNQSAPSGVVYQYFNLAPAGYSTITGASINFTVPQSWLDENHIAPESIGLYRLTANGWEVLPTTMSYAKDGMVQYSALSVRFSVFAIAGMPTIPAPAAAVTIPTVIGSPSGELAPAAATHEPVATQTTVGPDQRGIPAGSSPFPVEPALIGIACVGFIGGGVAARRWWIRRQNPVLFAENE